MPESLLSDAILDDLRGCLEPFTVDAVHALLGPIGRSAHERGDLAGVARVLDGSPLTTLLRLFVLGVPVAAHDARAALGRLDPAAAPELLAVDGDRVRARLEIRPYSADDADGSSQWWVASDFGSDVRPGPLAADHVLGIGSASLTLAQAVPRAPVGRALDLGTGCGVQALHLGAHARHVVATDVSPRALALAATTAALSGQAWDLRAGSLLDPVADDTFDLVVCNPPFVVSPGLSTSDTGYDYRDSGLSGDDVCARLLQGIPPLLSPGGSASLLANWIVPGDGDWPARLAGWLDGSGCTAWVWQREVADPGTYVSLWLRDAGETPGTERWAARYDAWCDWFERSGIAAVGMGLVTLWRDADGRTDVVCEDVPQAVEQPVGTHLPDWVRRRRWLATHTDADLLASRLTCADGVVRVRQDLLGEDGWRTALAGLRQSYGMCWEVDVDDAVAGLVAACDGATPLAAPVGVLAMVHGTDTAAIARAVLPVVRDLVARGFLLPAADGTTS